MRNYRKTRKNPPYDYEKKKVDAGTEAKIFNISCKFGIMRCYDTVFPGVADMLSKKEQKFYSPQVEL
tara:strand:+ start:408 stop:608 length:201 start_codon:yes stop_codon:yes gene_type:complete